MPNLKLFWFGLLPTLLKMVDLCNGKHFGHTNLPLPSSLSERPQSSKKLQSIVLLQIKKKLNETSNSLFLNY